MIAACAGVGALVLLAAGIFVGYFTGFRDGMHDGWQQGWTDRGEY